MAIEDDCGKDAPDPLHILIMTLAIFLAEQLEPPNSLLFALLPFVAAFRDMSFVLALCEYFMKYARLKSFYLTTELMATATLRDHILGGVQDN
jgi:hypothetical protein